MEGDRILAIDRQVLDTNISHERSIQILQAAQGHVELVVARTPHTAHTASTVQVTQAQIASQPSPDKASQPSSLPESSDMVVSSHPVLPSDKGHHHYHSSHISCRFMTQLLSSTLYLYCHFIGTVSYGRKMLYDYGIPRCIFSLFVQV